MANTGRPTSYNQKLEDAICEEIATTDHSLRRICEAAGMPSPSTVYLWLGRVPEFSEQYARARERQADVLAGQILEISDDGSRDTIQTEDGEVVNHEHIQRSRLRVDSRKWLASKLAPKKYGEKVATELSGPDGGPIQETLTV